MARDFTTNNFLLPQIRVLGDFPDDDPRTTDDILLQIANRRLLVELVPFLQKVRGDYWLKREVTPLVGSQTRYRIPSRSVAAGLDSVYWQRDTSNPSDQDIYQLDYLSLRDGVEDYNAFWYGNRRSDYPFGYHVEADEIVISPEPANSQGQLIFFYNRTPNELVKTGTSDVLVITGITDNTNVTVATNANFADGSYTCDVIQNKSNYDSLSDDVSITKTGTAVTFGSAVTGLSVGDYVCIAGTSPVAQIPRETQDLLAIGVAAEACRSRKDIATAQLLEQDYMTRSQRVFDMLSPRVRRQNEKLISRNSPLRRGNNWRRYSYR